ncbi:MAG: fibronectin type III domain-containing protein, partial [Patescibacteria group bacterium]
MIHLIPSASARKLTAAALLVAQFFSFFYGIPIAEAAANDVIITEFLADPTNVSDSNGEWIELYNTQNSAIPLTGWTIDDGNGPLSLTGLSVPAHGYVVIGNDSNVTTNGGVSVDFQAALNLDNASGTLTLNDGAVDVDVVTYAAVTAGASWSLDDLSLDNSLAANWHVETYNKFNANDYGTPRAANSPEQPQNVAATDGGADVVAITWDAVTGADSYTIYRDGAILTSGVAATNYNDDIDGSLDVSTLTLSANSTTTDTVDVTWTAASAVDSTTYNYTVRAVRDGVSGAVSAGDNGDVTPVISDYELFALDTPDTSVGTTGGLLTKQHAGLTGDTANVYKVRAFSADTGWTALSANSIEGASLPATPPDPTVAADYSAANGYTATVSAYAPAAGTWTQLEIDETSGNSGGSDRASSSSSDDYVDTGLSGDTQYCYRVRAKNSLGDYGDYSNTICATTPPAKPGTLTGAAAATDQIDWSWTDVVEDQNGYTGYDETDTAKFTTAQNVVTHSEGSLSANTAYSRYIRAKNTTNQEGEATSTTTKYTKQNAPTSLTFSNISATGITATANGTFANATLGSTGIYFDESVSAENSGWQQGTSWNLMNLTPNTTYSFTAKARNGDAVETTMTNDTQTTLAEVPTAPTLTIGTGANHYIDVALDLGNNPAATEFAILNTNTNQYLQGDGTVGAVTVWQTEAAWEVAGVNRYSNLAANTQYGFKLIARNSDNIATAASAASYIFTDAETPDTAPTIAAATAENQLTISLSDTSGNAAGTLYAIQETSTGNYVQANGTLGAVEFWDVKENWQNIAVTGLAADTQFTFQAKAKNSEGASTGFSPTSSKYTLADTVSALTLTNTTDALDYKLQLTWTNNSATGHKIEIDTGNDGTYETVLYDNPTVLAVSPHITPATPNTAYKFRMASYNAEGVLNTVTYAVSNVVTTPPDVPANLGEGAGSTTTQLVWDWDDTAAATGYKIYDSGDAEIGDTAASTFTDTPLGVNTASTVYVRAYNANGEGVKTALTTRYTDANAPTNPSGTAASTAQIDWSWQVNGNPAGTEFYAESTSGNSQNWLADAIAWSDTPLTANTNYTLSVKSRNADSEESSTVSTSKYTWVDVPAIPTFGTVSIDSIEVNSSVATNQSDAEANFTNETDAVSSGFLGDNVFTWTNGSLNPNTQYTYSVAARNGDEVANPTSSASASKYTLANVPNAPTVAVVAGSPTQLTLDVNNSAAPTNPAATEYDLLIDNDGNATGFDTTNFVDGTGALGAATWQTDAIWGTQTITGLTANTRYFLATRARNAENIETVNSTAVEIFTLADQVTGATVDASGWDSTNNYNAVISYALNGATNVRILRVNDSTDVYTGSATSFTDANLAANTTYTYRIFSLNAAGAENSNYVEVSATTPPAIAAGLTAAASDNSSIDWDWGDVVGAASYNIYNQATGNLIANVAVSNQTQTLDDSVSANPLDPNTVYSVFVRAVNANGEGAPSANASGYTAANTPNNLAGSATGTTAIDWSWAANSNPGTTNYYAQDDATPNNIQDWSTALTWSDDADLGNTDEPTPLTANTQYTLSVKARNDGAPLSETGFATTAKFTSIETPTLAPTLLAKDSTSIQIQTGESFSNLTSASSALIFNETGLGDRAPTTATATTFGGLTPDTDYVFKFKAQNGDGVATLYSPTLAVTTYADMPLAPTLNSATTTTFNAIVNGAPTNPGSTLYYLQVDDDGDGTSFNTIQYVQADGSLGALGTAATFTDGDSKIITWLTSNEFFRVRAVAVNNNSDFGSEATIYTSVAIPDAPTVTLPAALGTLAVTLVDSSSNSAANTEYAIAVDDDGDATEFNTTNYLDASGNVVGAAVWIDAATWGTVSAVGLGDDNQIYFKVKARNASDLSESAFGASASKVTQAAQITGFTATENSTATDYAIDLSWNVGNQSGLRISQSTDGGTTFPTVICDDVTGAPVVCGGSPFSVTGLNGNTDYVFRAEAYNSEDVLNSSSPAETTAVTTAPEAATNLTASAVSDNQITWQWDDVATATDYNIYNASNDALIGSTVDDGTANPQTFDHTALSPNNNYSVYVRAVNANGEGTKSANASATTDASLPAGLASDAAALTTSQIKLDWTVNGNPAGTEFCAFDNTATPNESGAGCAATADGTAGAGWFADLITWSDNGATTTLAANTQYTLEVRARNSANTQTAAGAATIQLFSGVETPAAPSLNNATATTLTLGASGVTNPASADFYF